MTCNVCAHGKQDAAIEKLALIPLVSASVEAMCAHVCDMQQGNREDKVWWNSMCNLLAYTPYSSIMNKLSVSMGASPFGLNPYNLPLEGQHGQSGMQVKFLYIV